MPFNDLRKELRKYMPKNRIIDAYEAFIFAKDAHDLQLRSSGEPYIIHPVATAKILAKMRLDIKTIISALLHDVLEDTTVNRQMLVSKFGEEITTLVDGVTKLSKIHFESKEQAKAENFRKMIMAMAKDIRVILIKLADRLHNMRTLKSLSSPKQQRIARETLDIYTPIANRLGMYNIMTELEELSLGALFPIRYRVLKNTVQKNRGHRKNIINTINKTLKDQLKKQKVKILKVFGREKHLYSIYKKMQKKKSRFADIMDVYAFRIIVEDITTCYQTLGIVHNLYKPLQKRFKDFIAIPKKNGYQSLHTTLFGPYGIPIEIQIRTLKMDQIAESGIAAHWLYKNQIQESATIETKEWIHEILQMQQHADDSIEFIENIKTNLFPDEIFVFTPNGNIIKLPKKSTPIDFAYAVDASLGNNCIITKVNHYIVPLDRELKSGETVEIITAPNTKPDPNWLSFVVTGKARSSIRYFLKNQKRKESINLGRYLLNHLLKEQRLSLSQLKKNKLKQMVNNMGFNSLDDLLEQIGLAKQKINPIINYITDHLPKPTYVSHSNKRYKKINNTPFIIEGTNNTLINFANCCYPMPNDAIIGMLDDNDQIIVHQDNCQNVATHTNPNQFVKVCWGNCTNPNFITKLSIYSDIQTDINATLQELIRKEQVNIMAISNEKNNMSHHQYDLIINVKSRSHLNEIINHIKEIKGVSKIN